MSLLILHTNPSASQSRLMSNHTFLGCGCDGSLSLIAAGTKTVLVPIALGIAFKCTGEAFFQHGVNIINE